MTSNTRQMEHRTVGDYRTPFAVTLQQDGTAVDLTGLTVKFALDELDGTNVIAATASGVNVTTAASGEVQYTFSTSVPAGVYAAYFTVDSSGSIDTFPHDGQRMLIQFVDGP